MKELAMTVYFIGAGPGAPDLVTVRGLRLIEKCPLCLYAGSLVPVEIVAAAPAKVIDTAPLDLDSIVSLIQQAHSNGEDVARVHSGDPSLYGAIGEQMRLLRGLGIPYEIIPGVPAFAAAAAALQRELTLPGVSQTVILSRTSVNSSPMPAGEELAALGRIGATLVLHLSIRNLSRVVADLLPHYGDDCPAAVVFRASWPDQHIVTASLGALSEAVAGENIQRSALIIVGRVLSDEEFSLSRLYDSSHARYLRPAPDVR